MKRRLTTIDRWNERMIYLVVGADSEPERIPVYNQILRSASPKFRRLVESMDLESVELEIVGVPKKIMSILIEYIYHTFEDGPASLPMTEENVHDFFFAANKFELMDVKSLCRDYFENHITITENNCIQLLLKTSELTSVTFKAKCLDFLLSSLAQILTTQSFINLTATHLVLVIREGRAKGNCSEDVLCDAAINWMKNRSQEINAEIKELITEFPYKQHKQLIVQALHEIGNPELKEFAFDLLMKLYHREANSMTTAKTTTTETVANNTEAPSTSEKSRSQSNDNNRSAASSSSSHARNNVEVAAHVNPLNIPTIPLPWHQEGSSCSDPNNKKRTRSNASDEISSSTSPFPLNDAVKKSPVAQSSANRTLRNNCNVILTNCDIDAHVTSSSKRPAVSSPSSSEPRKPKKNKIQSRVTTVISGAALNFALNKARKKAAAGTRIGGCCGDTPRDKECTIFFLGSDRSNGNNKVDLWSFNLHDSLLKRIDTAVPKDLKHLKYLSLQYYGGRIYFMGSLASNSPSTKNLHIFHVATNSWTKVDMLESRYLQSIRLDNSLFVFAQRERDESSVAVVNNVEKFSLNTEPMDRELIELQDHFSRLRSYCGLVVFNGKIFTIGGEIVSEGVGWQVTGVCQEFYPDLYGKGRWKSIKAVLSMPRNSLLAVSTEAEIYAIGGWTQQGDKSTTVEILRIGSDVWELGPNLIKARAHASGVYCREQNAIFVFGGDSVTDPTVETLDLTTGKWSLFDCKESTMLKYLISVAHRPCA